MFDAGSASDGALQRSRGAARIRFDAPGGRSRLIERYASTPMRLLTPRVAGGAPEVVLANTAGGVTGDDRLDIVVTADAGADATVSGQAAEKVYRALNAPARLSTTLTLDAGATLEWLPQETILFDGARLDRTIDVKLAGDARLLMAETLVFGRKAFGEAFAAGRLEDRWSIDRDNGPVWRDRLHVDGGGAALNAPTGLRGARALSTILYAAPDAAERLELLRDLIDKRQIFGGATVTRGLLVARLLGDEAGALKRALAEIIGAFRHAALGRPATAPRVWLC